MPEKKGVLFVINMSVYSVELENTVNSNVMITAQELENVGGEALGGPVEDLALLMRIRASDMIDAMRGAITAALEAPPEVPPDAHEDPPPAH